MIFNEGLIKTLDNTTSLHSVPFTIADDMVSMLDDTDFFKEPDLNMTATEYINSHRVIDVSCKSGSLLFSFYKKFMIALRNVFPDRDDRDYFIVRNLLFGLCPSARYLSVLRDTFYSNKKYDLSKELGNFYHYDFKTQVGVDSKEAKELLENMKFDVVCGNPPYNNDMYIDFITRGHSLARNYDLWITPAKSCLSEDYKNKIISSVLYPSEGDVFPITMPCGIVYFLAGKANLTKHEVELRSKNFKAYNVSGQMESIVTFNLICNDILARLGTYESFKPEIYKLSSLPFRCAVLKQVYTIGGSNNRHRGLFYADEKMGSGFVIHNCNLIASDDTGNKICIFASDSLEECDSFKSWVNTKFVRFMLSAGLEGYGNAFLDYYWRLVPHPGRFDKIYEDEPLSGYTPDINGEYIDENGFIHCSLCRKYKVSYKEWLIINSVIKDRNSCNSFLYGIQVYSNKFEILDYTRFNSGHIDCSDSHSPLVFELNFEFGNYFDYIKSTLKGKCIINFIKLTQDKSKFIKYKCNFVINDETASIRFQSLQNIGVYNASVDGKYITEIYD